MKKNKYNTGRNTSPQIPKNYPHTFQHSPNVNPVRRYNTLPISPEEAAEQMREKILLKIKHLLLDLGDKICSRKEYGDLVLFTEVYKPDNSDILLEIDTTDSSTDLSIKMSEFNDTLKKYIETQLDPPSTRRMIRSVVSYYKAKHYTDDFLISFDNDNISITGDKSQVIKMKWVLVDILQRVYDSEGTL
jgi:hypothetical protein